MHFLPPHMIRDHSPPTLLEDRYHPLLMPYAKGIQTEGTFGSIITQHFAGADFSVWKHHFTIQQDTILYAYTDVPILTMNFMLEGSPIAQAPGIGELTLAENSYQLFYVPATRQEVWFPKGTYTAMNIVFSQDYIEKFARKYPGLHPYIRCATVESDQLFLHETGIIDGPLGQLITDLVQDRNDEDQAAFHTQTVIRQIILYYIRKHYGARKPILQRAIIEKLDTVRAYIDGHLDRDLSISALSAQFNCSAATLQRQFKEHFGQALYEYFFNKRMEKGMALLLENNYSVGEISDMLGYKNASTFINAFNRKFGIPPMFYLRSNKSKATIVDNESRK